MITDSGTAAKYELGIIGGQFRKFKSFIGVEIVNMINSFMEGSESISFNIDKKKLYVTAGDREMWSPLFVKPSPLSVDLFYPDLLELAEVDIDALSTFLKLLVNNSREDWNRVTFKFDEVLRLESGQDTIEEVPVSIKNTGQFDVNGDYMHKALTKVYKKGGKCKICVDAASGERVVIVEDTDTLRFIIQGLA